MHTAARRKLSMTVNYHELFTLFFPLRSLASVYPPSLFNLANSEADFACEKALFRSPEPFPSFDAAPLILQPSTGISSLRDCCCEDGCRRCGSSCSARRLVGTIGGVDRAALFWPSILLRSEAPLPLSFCCCCCLPFRTGDAERVAFDLPKLVLVALSDCVRIRPCGSCFC